MYPAQKFNQKQHKKQIVTKCVPLSSVIKCEKKNTNRLVQKQIKACFEQLNLFFATHFFLTKTKPKK